MAFLTLLRMEFYSSFGTMLRNLNPQGNSNSVTRHASRPNIGKAVFLLCFAAHHAYGQASRPQDLTQMNLEDLMNLQVTSVAKKKQSLSKTGAAVFVVTQEDIRRSGARNLPDALRLVPGVQVAQIERNRWAVSIRGFQDLAGNKVLVLIDGRSVYRDSFSGVFWDELDMPMENIDRIEVIRGPGGTVWGANAVNGVINVLTKSARDTQGMLVTAVSGSDPSEEGTVQFGGKAGRSGAYRVFGKYNTVNNTTGPRDQNALDGFNHILGGFRSDWNLSGHDSLTVQGDFSRLRSGQKIDVPSSNTLLPTDRVSDQVQFTGGNVVARWNHTFQNGSDASLQFFDDRYVRLDIGLRDSANVADFDFQHHFAFKNRHDIVWGAAYRSTNGTSRPGAFISFNPLDQSNQLASTFVQDEFAITPSLSLTLGSKFERNSLTGFEYEPGIQVVWEKSKRQTFWMSAAKAVRQPSKLDHHGFVEVQNVPLGSGSYGVLQLVGDPDGNIEQLRSAQAGYRMQRGERLSFDTTFFLSSYHDLQTVEPLDPYLTFSKGPPHLIFPLMYDSYEKAKTFGIEVSASWRASHRWRLSPQFSTIHLAQSISSANGKPAVDPGLTARYLLGIRSSLNVTSKMEWDATLSNVPSVTTTPGYTRVDSRLGWKFGERTELSLVGQNLLSSRHLEFSDTAFILSVPVQRTVFGKITWYF